MPSPDAILEAVLVAADGPLTADRLREVLGFEGVALVRQAVETLNERYRSGERALAVEEVAGGYRLATLPAAAAAIERLYPDRPAQRLSPAAVETLAIIAYRQPVSRADIEGVRGVQVGPVIQGLVERDLIRIDGRAETAGRPILYGTTRRFLELFGLKSLQDLPAMAEFGLPDASATGGEPGSAPILADTEMPPEDRSRPDPSATP